MSIKKYIVNVGLVEDVRIELLLEIPNFVCFQYTPHPRCERDFFYHPYQGKTESYVRYVCRATFLKRLSFKTYRQRISAQL